MQMDLENSDLRNRTQFDKSYNINFRDGDKRSTRAYDEEVRHKQCTNPLI